MSSSTIHHEFISSSSHNSTAWRLFHKLSKHIRIVELRVTSGTPTQKKTARKLARSLNVRWSDLVFPKAGSLLAVLGIPDSFDVKQTDSIKDRFASQIKTQMPYVLTFKIVRWFKPQVSIVMGTSDRTAFSMTSFGIAPNGLPPM